jgi:hypothetical protein
LQGQQLSHGRLLVADGAGGHGVGQDVAQVRQGSGLDVSERGAAGKVGEGIEVVGHVLKEAEG